MTELVSSLDGVVITKTDVSDVRRFNGLINSTGGSAFFRATFGQFNFSVMVESSCICLAAQVAGNDSCVGFLAVDDCPFIGKEGEAYDETIDLIKSEFIPDVSKTNALFLNFLLLDEKPDFDIDAVGFDLFYNAFAMNPDMDYILWLCPPSVKLTPWTESNFTFIDTTTIAEESKSGDFLSGHKLLYLHRNNILPKLLIRNAQIEDNDDLTPILRNSNPGVFEGQGNYFLADLIEQQDDDNRFFVGVDKNIPVGMLVSSVDVNVGLITKVFDVDQFPDMFIANEKKSPPPPLVVGLVGDIRSLSDSTLDSLLSKSGCVMIDAEKLELPPVSEQKDPESDIEVQEADLQNARQIADIIQAKITEVANANLDSPPPFCVVKGYPRTDAEAQIVAENDLIFDMVLELYNNADDADIDEIDDFQACHLDAVEALQNFLSADNAPYWKKIIFGGDTADSCDEVFSPTFTDLVDTRIKEVAAIAAKEEEAPPKANAFAITVFCMKDGFESRCDDLLRVVFEDHPDLDYCMFMVPNNSSTPNLLVGSMIATKLRTGVSFDQTLYIAHKESLMAFNLMKVDRLMSADSKKLNDFIAPLGEGSREVLDACKECENFNDVVLKDNPVSSAFEVKIGDDVVGVVTLSRKHIGNDDINWLRSNYEIEKFVNYDRHRARAQAYITHMVINPVFSRKTRFIIREIMRKYAKSVIYYQTTRDLTPPKEIMDELIAVAPRRRMECVPGAELPLLVHPSVGSSVDSPLFHITKKLLTSPKKIITKRIVVVGGGSSSYAFLEKLCFTPDTTFPNIYFICDSAPKSFQLRNGNKDDTFSDGIAGCLSIDDPDDPTLTELYAYGFAHRVNVIRGRLTDIDRDNKAVIVSDEMVVEYDILVMASTTKDKSFKKFPATSGMHSSFCEKRGIFGIGDPYIDQLALDWTLKQDKTKLEVVVYGLGINIVGAIGKLGKMGVQNRRITAVLPNDELPENCHPNMNEAIIRNLRSSGVKIHRGFDVKDVELSPYGTVQGVFIQKLKKSGDEGEEDTLLIPCYSLICAHSMHCDPDIFTAINDCGIVFDGGMVVDKDFCTCDPNIYAVGDFTRFSRIHRNELVHSNHNAREMGNYVATRIMEKHLNQPSSAAEIMGNAVPKFNYPKSCIVPIAGDRFYFNSKISNDAHDALVLMTGNLQSDRLCALKIDSLGTLLEIVYIGKSQVEAKNLAKLVGWHESYLNAAIQSYEDEIVTDWIEFFRSEWTTAIFHDNFNEFATLVRESLASDKGTYTILDRIADVTDASTENDAITTEWRKSAGKRGETLDAMTRRIIETQTLEYLRKNKVMLTRFALPQAKRTEKNKEEEKK